MDEQLDLPTPRARTSDPSTSHEAAASVNKLTDTKLAILQCFATHVGSRQLTDFDLALIYQGRRATDFKSYPRVSDSGLRSRRVELERAGFIEACGTGSSPSGRSATIFRATNKGLDLVV